MRTARINVALGCLTIVTLVLGKAQAQTTVDFGSSPSGPITNNPSGGGDFVGDEYKSLGLLFAAAPGHILNIGCGTPAGDPANCLGADRAAPNDFEGTVVASFELGGVRQVTDQITIGYVNADPPPTRTVIRDAAGNVLLDQPSGDVNFFAPGIASVEIQFTFDGANTFTFGPLTPACGSASWQNYGTGHPGSLGVPQLTLDANPVQGTSPNVQVGNSLGTATHACIFVASARAMLPTPFGGDVLVGPLNEILVFAVSLPDNQIQNFRLPIDSSVACGHVVTIQVVEADPGASAGISFSAGLEVIVGR